jgi:hypothetical protein
VILSKFGFHPKFIGWIMSCITTVQYKIRINGSLTKGFKPSRGIRQGDSLSPYLFLFVGEGLSKILQRVVYLQELCELKICRRAPGVSHLLFADDSLLFFEANESQASLVKDAIGIFEIGSGQLINPSDLSYLVKATPKKLKRTSSQSWKLNIALSRKNTWGCQHQKEE